ncbi:MAG: hypothetical protein ACREMY_21560 [bacterium]
MDKNTADILDALDFINGDERGVAEVRQELHSFREDTLMKQKITAAMLEASALPHHHARGSIGIIRSLHM